jgi:hypothetical protein
MANLDFGILNVVPGLPNDDVRVILFQAINFALIQTHFQLPPTGVVEKGSYPLIVPFTTRLVTNHVNTLLK